MRLAIYFLAVGEPAIRCLDLSHQALRQAGFTGDVFILTDQETVPFSLPDTTHVCTLRPEHLNLDPDSTAAEALFDVRKLDTDNPRNARNPRKWTICRAKTLIDRYVVLADYDYLIYLDVDVLTQGPIEDLEIYLQTNDGSIVTAQNQEGERLGGRGNISFRKLKRVKTYSAANLSNVELLKHWFTKAMCSDIVCIPANANGQALLKAWREECLKNIDYDQPALQAVLLRQFNPLHKLAPYSLFGYGPRHTSYNEEAIPKNVSSTFVHFGGAIKDSRVFTQYYEQYINE